MVGVAGAMVISQVHEDHELICTMYENLKKVPKSIHCHFSERRDYIILKLSYVIIQWVIS